MPQRHTTATRAPWTCRLRWVKGEWVRQVLPLGQGQVGWWANRRSCGWATCHGDTRAAAFPPPGTPAGFGVCCFFFFLSWGFAWNSDAHVVQNSLAPTSGASCKSHLPAQAGQAAAGLGTGCRSLPGASCCPHRLLGAYRSVVLRERGRQAL